MINPSITSKSYDIRNDSVKTIIAILCFILRRPVFVHVASNTTSLAESKQVILYLVLRDSRSHRAIPVAEARSSMLL